MTLTEKKQILSPFRNNPCTRKIMFCNEYKYEDPVNKYVTVFYILCCVVTRKRNQCKHYQMVSRLSHSCQMLRVFVSFFASKASPTSNTKTFPAGGSPSRLCALLHRDCRVSFFCFSHRRHDLISAFLLNIQREREHNT